MERRSNVQKEIIEFMEAKKRKIEESAKCLNVMTALFVVRRP